MSATTFDDIHSVLELYIFYAFLNEKVGFKIPTTRYRKYSILCGVVLESGLPV